MAGRSGTGLLLSIDTSAASCAAALLSASGELVAARDEAMERGQAERLFPMIGELLAEAGIGWDGLTAVGVGTGPGNFTGIRIAVAAGRGLALSLGVPAVGVTAFEALRFGHEDDAPVLALVDARQGRAYAQLALPGAAPGEPLVVDPGALPQAMRHPGALVVGFGAEAVAETIGGRAVPSACPFGEAVGRVALTRLDGTVPRPSPLYVRPPDAAPPREAPPVILP